LHTFFTMQPSISTDASEVRTIRCAVCGYEIPSIDRVDCALCKTPHHRDCWHYFGGCSTYACGERLVDERTTFLALPEAPFASSVQDCAWHSSGDGVRPVVTAGDLVALSAWCAGAAAAFVAAVAAVVLFCSL